jgi:UTP--glucose-1-phosphate uridylyltransferase
MIQLHEEHGMNVIAVQEVAEESIPSYGVVEVTGREGDVVRISGMVEKPAVKDAPSNLASRGRYFFTPEIFDAIAKTSEGVGGEIQLTDAIAMLAREGRVLAYVHPGPILDVGKKQEYLRASIELALMRDDLSGPLREYIIELAKRLNAEGP